MSATIVYLPEAKSDILIAHSNYEQRQTGLGDRFPAQVHHRLDVISDNPELYAILQDETRAAPMDASGQLSSRPEGLASGNQSEQLSGDGRPTALPRHAAEPYTNGMGRLVGRRTHYH